MTDDQHEEGASRGGSRWDPLPQGDYDDGATAFVKLPEGGIEALLAAREPLAAPGHGYVPPQINVAPAPPAAADPDTGGTWAGQGGNTQWPDPDAGQPRGGAHDDRFTYHPGSTGQWQFEDGAGQGRPQGPGHDVTGQWSIPLAAGDLPDESGEFTTSALVEQWGSTPPATLPGGAAAPWAGEIGQPWTADTHETATEALAGPAGQSGAESPAQAAEGPVQPAREATEFAAGPGPVTAGTHGVAEPDPAHEAAVTDGETPDEDLPAPAGHNDHPLASYVLRVNGADRPVTDAWVGESLLYVLRERLGLAGAKDGCSQGECGACNVQVDGRLVASCLVPGVTAAGSEVRTVEGLAADGQSSDVQRALAKCGAVQCGFCVPGMAMTLHDLLEGNPAPTELETRQALCGNLCRCSGYRGVLDAVREVVAEREAHSAAAAEAAPETDTARIPHQAGPGAGGVHPSAYEDGAAYGSPAQHEQPYGQDGGQA
ncbi:2Fe-2S iron-sulfur cluster-binding protein [Streptomyces sp. NBC_00151]|uniref:2Fe-2S iron-sulfur cluster-binding protein n=1 Tax=Streptomyces sp. NBC_00151 TaxID=2975669 RepID=UPI002DD7A0DD|nr:2Fe-2S iron-sulfur cluster-binding protein [Streptomyces sp. NBC_00151]WRZ41478.1 2Fe-2S iron-sulfur cluster-binding protein [Streptomyces sp. NBC_00151]